MRKLIWIAALAALLPAGACTITEDPSLEGLSFRGGDAIAANNALQRIDPWPPGVQDNDLVVPAERAKKKVPQKAPASSEDTVAKSDE
jgi:hypothetical protein